MDENKFFKVLWRVNAILMTCACVLGIGDFIYQQITLRSRVEPFVEGYYNVQTAHLSETGETVVDAKWRYGVIEQVTDSLVLLPIYSVEEDARRRQSNVLLVDTSEPEGAKWLWPESPYRIRNNPLMFDERTIAVLYEAVDEEGSIAKGLITEEESNSNIYMTRPNNTELTLIITDVERIIDYVVMTEKDLVIFYVKAGEGRVMKVDLTDFSVVVDTALPDPP